MIVLNTTYMNRSRHTYSNVHRYMIFFVLLIFGTQLNAQTISATECSCLNNASAAGGDGQFTEVITINDPRDSVWRVKSVTGLFTSTSPAPPLAPVQVAVNSMITRVSSGVHRLTARRIENTSWTIVVTDGVRHLSLTSQRMCKYPSRKFIGDKGVCISKSKKYKLDVPNNLINSINWNIVSGPGSISGSTSSPEVTVNFSNSTGQVILRAQGSAKSFVEQTSGFCNFDLRDTIQVINDPTAIALACKGHVNITLLGNCQLEITPEMILEDIQRPLHHYDVILRDVQADTFLPTPRVDGRYINKRLEVSIFHECSGNSCWGTLLLEDKAIPPLVCDPSDTVTCDKVDFPELTGMPLPATAFVTKVSANTYDVVGYDFCSTVRLTYSDVKLSAHCHGDIGAVIRRTWVARDGAGNTTTCQQDIHVKKATFMNIMWPADYDDVLGPNPSLGACADWQKLPNGHPHPDFTGKPTGLFCSNLNVEFEDVRFKICENEKTFKIRRKWTIVDICTGEIMTHIQTIAIMDNTPPVCEVADSLVVETADKTCTGTITVPVPKVTDCINWSYSVAIKPFDNSDDPYTGATTDGISQTNGGIYIIQNLSENHTKYWLSYYIFDGCSNHTRCYTTITIKDTKAPVAVCKQYTFVALNEQGLAWAGFDAFDNGSYDNCAIGKIELRRMQDSSCFRRNEWSDKVLFCCEDLGKTVMVIMRVTDKSGNSNECMVEVTVQDNTPPKFHKCPVDTFLTCGQDIHNLARFGAPVVIDSCGFTLDERVVKALNECGIGKITRVFTATDKSGNKSTCMQMIEVRPTTLFGPDNITWPTDYTVNNGCRNLRVNPEDLPVVSRFPTWKMQPPCSQPAYDYEDIVFQYADSACFKIVREWKVIDWCQFDRSAPNQVIATHKQVIRVLNNTAPTITKGCGPDDLSVEDGGGPCNARIRMTAEGTDDCGGPVFFNYEIDFDNNGTIDTAGNDRFINMVVRFGNHRISWTARDECGNISRCSRVYNVKDVKKPTPICFTQIVSVVMPSSKMITLWAKDFVKEATDNCSPASKIKFSFTEDRKDSSKVFTCEDLVEYGAEGIPIRIYAFDTTGNFDYCDARLILQDNSGACTGVNASARSSLSGKVTDFDYKPMGGVNVTLQADAIGYPKKMSTSAQGEYTFTGLRQGMEYSWSAQMDDQAIKGVNTLDVISVQRHILGLQRITDPMKLIAADVNFDQKITITDIISLRQLILGITENFQGNVNWKFVNTKQMPTMADLYPLNEVYLVEKLTNNMPSMDFMGIKIGDIDGSYANSNLQGRSGRFMTVTEEESTAGSGKSFTFGVEESTLTNGLQLEFKLNNILQSGTIDIKSEDENFDVNYFVNNDENKVRVVIISKDGKPHIAGKSLFTMRSDFTIMSEDITLSSGFDHSLYSVESSEAENYSLELRQSSKADFGLKVYQNTPNPFTNETELVFEIGKEEDVTIKVFNAEGRAVYSKQAVYPKGKNTVKISGHELDAEGILIYQILTKTHYSGRKMIKLK